MKIKILTLTALVALMAHPAAAGNVSLDIRTDFWPTETSFELIYDPGGASTMVEEIAPGDLTLGGYLYQWDWTLDGGQYEWTIYDSFGDGISAPGGFRLTVLSTVIMGNMGAGWWGTDRTAGFSIPDGPEPVPEPATVLLLGTGLVGLAGLRKKFKK